MAAAGASLTVAAPAQAAGSVLVDEGFTGTAVADPRFVPLGSACLTAAPRPSSPPAGYSTLSYCANTKQSPAATTPGWLQLTDASLTQVGGVLFNQALPSADGLQVTFQQAQYGGNGADGIGFFLSNGAYNLTTTGASGGSLGYSPGASGGTPPGVVGGFIGLGLDVFGNYATMSGGPGLGCNNSGIAAGTNASTTNAVGLRGPGWTDSSGHWTQGYCLLGFRQTPTLRTGTSSPAFVRITVSPTASNGSVTVTAELSYDGGSTYTQYLSKTVPNAPTSYKFGFTGSTGGSTDVHLVHNLTVSTVNSLGSIGLVAQEDQSSASYRSIYQVGDVIPYQFVVTNPSLATLSSVSVTDPQLDGPVSCPTTTLASAGTAGSSMTCTGQHTVTAADVTSTTSLVSYSTTASVTASAGGSPVSTTGSHQVSLGTAALSLTKTADQTTGLTVGSVVHYTFSVTNTGSIPVGAVTVSDPLTGLVNGTCVSSLAVGATASCAASGSHQVTQADMNAGSVVNTATATGLLPATVSGPSVTAQGSRTVYTAPANPGLSLMKSVLPATVSSVGQLVTYSFHVTNTGNVTMSGITVHDTGSTGTGSLSAITCPSASLDPGLSENCAASYTVTQADLDSGGVSNTATVSGLAPGASVPTTSLSGQAVLDVAASPAISLALTASPTSVTHTGQQVTYTYTRTNTGNVTLSGVTTASTVFSGTGSLSSMSCTGGSSLAPGASSTCTATYTVTQADMNAGTVAETAVATGTSPSTTLVTSNTPQAVVTATQSPHLALSMSSNPTAFDHAGQQVTYTFSLHNNGNVTLGNIGMLTPTTTGSGTLSAVTCSGVTSLDPGQSTTCTATYTVSQADVDGGSVTLQAVASATTPTAQVYAGPVVQTMTAVQIPGLSLLKTVSPTTVSAVGDPVTFSYLMTNTGNVTLGSVGVQEKAFTGTGTLSSVSCAAGSLAPGGSQTCTATYAATQADLDAGSVSNTAVAYGTPPGSATAFTSASSTALVASVASPKMSVVASASPTSVSQVGQQVSYTFHVTNAGNVTMGTVAVTDSGFTGSGTLSAITCPPGPLAPSSSEDCTATYTVTQADLDAGSIHSPAVAEGRAPRATDATVSTPSDAVVGVQANPALTLVQTAAPTTVAAVGDQVTYSYQVTNSGNVTMSSIGISQGSFSGSGTAPVVTCPPGALAPGASQTCTATYLVTQADLDAGHVVSTVSAVGTPPGTNAAPIASDSQTSSVAVDAHPAINATTTAQAAPGGPGQVVHFTVHVTNTGNVTVNDLVLHDSSFTGSGTAPTFTCPSTVLAPGQSQDCTGSYTLTSKDQLAGVLKTTVTVEGTPPVVFDAPVVSVVSDASVTVASAGPAVGTGGYLVASHQDGGWREVWFALVALAGAALAGVAVVAGRRRRRETH